MLTRWQAFKLKVWNWFKNSGTLVLARVQYVFGLLFAGLIATFSTYDWNSLVSMDTKTAFKMLIAAAVSGVITEWVRRRGTVVEKLVVANEATNFVPVTVERLERAEPSPPPQG